MAEPGFLSMSRIRLIRQNEMAECGLAVLAMVSSYYGLDTDLAYLRRRFAISNRGTSLRSLMEIASELGFSTRAVKLPLEELGNLNCPCVLHWDLNHFVVLERAQGERFLIHDSVGKSGWISKSEISNHFTGIALELRPGDNFQKGRHLERVGVFDLLGPVQGLKRAIAQVLVLTFFLQSYVLLLPYYLQVSVDSIVPSEDTNLLVVLAIGFAVFTVFHVITSLLRSLILLVVGTKLGFVLTVNVAWNLFRLPVEWFEKRDAGDVLSRFQSVNPLKEALTKGAVSAVLDGVTSVLIFAAMLWYSVPLALSAIGALLLYGMTRVISFRAEKRTSEASIIEAGKEQTNMIESLNAMSTLRLTGQEALRHSFWQNKLADSINAAVRAQKVKIYQDVYELGIFGLENIISIFVAISLVMNAEGFSLGMLFAFFAYKGQFVRTSSSFIDTIASFRLLNLHLDRISDIALADEDRSFRARASTAATYEGNLELRDVSYRYSKSDPYVLKNLNLKVEAGQFVAIKGASGGGKSTLVKLMLGLIEAEEGDVLLDGMTIENFGYKNFHKQVAAVLQEDKLFAGTIAQNIALFSENIDMDEVYQAAILAAIHGEVNSMPMRYETLIGGMGSTLSGGQKQRVMLARALYRKPKMLILDEGTAHLNIELESRINSAISKLGITRIVIAHRPQTINAANIVYVMNDGILSRVDNAFMD